MVLPLSRPTTARPCAPASLSGDGLDSPTADKMQAVKRVPARPICLRLCLVLCLPPTWAKLPHAVPVSALSAHSQHFFPFKSQFKAPAPFSYEHAVNLPILKSKTHLVTPHPPGTCPMSLPYLSPERLKRVSKTGRVQTLSPCPLCNLSQWSLHPPPWAVSTQPASEVCSAVFYTAVPVLPLLPGWLFTDM